MTVFLCISGVSLFIAWFPDIVPTLLDTSKTLSLIGVYTTEITYVLDMGIISPLIFLCVYLLKKQIPLGTVILDAVLCLCSIVGIMIIFQSVFQALSHTNIPLPALITKGLIFVVLAGFAIYFRRKLHEEMRSYE